MAFVLTFSDTLQSSGRNAGPGLRTIKWGVGADKEVASTLGPSRTPGCLTLPKSALTEHIFAEHTGFYTQGGKHEQLAVYVRGP